MTLVQLLSSLPPLFYASIAAFAVLVMAELFMEKGGADAENGTRRQKGLKALIIPDLVLAGLIGFAITTVYFSWVLIADWRSSTGIFYPESSIDPESMPYVANNDFPPAPAAEKK